MNDEEEFQDPDTDINEVETPFFSGSPWGIVACGVAIFLICIGIGGCEYLDSLSNQIDAQTKHIK